MNKVKISGNISNITATGMENTSFDLTTTDGFSIPCIIEGAKSTIFYQLLIEGDSVHVTGNLLHDGGKFAIRISGLVMPEKEEGISMQPKGESI